MYVHRNLHATGNNPTAGPNGKQGDSQIRSVLSFPKTSRQALRPTETLIQWVPGFLQLRISGATLLLRTGATLSLRTFTLEAVLCGIFSPFYPEGTQSALCYHRSFTTDHCTCMVFGFCLLFGGSFRLRGY